MRVNAADGIKATASSEGNGRVQIRMGVNRYTCTPAEARDLAGQLIDAADRVERCRSDG